MLTIYLHLTEFYVRLRGIGRDMRYITLPCVVVYHVAPTNWTTDIHRTWYGSGIISSIMETEDSIFFFRCVGDIERKPQESACINAVFFKKKRINTFKQNSLKRYFLCLMILIQTVRTTNYY